MGSVLIYHRHTTNRCMQESVIKSAKEGGQKRRRREKQKAKNNTTLLTTNSLKDILPKSLLLLSWGEKSHSTIKTSTT